MVPLTMLWLPILVATVIVFVAGAIFWMVLPHHKTDYRGLPDEESVLGSLRRTKVAAGQYMFPFAGDRKAMTAEWKAKLAEGPAGFLIVRHKASTNMAPSLTQYFIWILIVETFVAYISSRSLSGSSDYLDVFQIAGTTAILGFTAALVPSSIWFGRPWSVTLKEIIDGIVYGLLSAGVFGWLWPRATDI